MLMSFVERHLLKNSSLKQPGKSIRGALLYYLDNANDQTADFTVFFEIINKKTYLCL